LLDTPEIKPLGVSQVPLKLSPLAF